MILYIISKISKIYSFFVKNISLTGLTPNKNKESCGESFPLNGACPSFPSEKLPPVDSGVTSGKEGYKRNKGNKECKECGVIIRKDMIMYFAMDISYCSEDCRVVNIV